MGRIVAIDYGKKRVGIAVTDPLKIIANGLATVQSKEIWEFLERYTSEQEVECFVVGYPKQLNNKPSEAARYVEPFVKKLQKRFPQIPTQLYDERFTSKLAKQAMIDGGLKKKRRRDKALVDEISATIILQNFMDSKSFV